MSKRILVVEDQEDLRGILRDLLTGTGYTVIEAADGEAGVAKAESERPDLVLMDIQMPVVDGYEATRRIKADPALKPIPIVAVSSYAMKGDEEKARASGCDHYVTKPYSPMQLMKIIRGLIRSRNGAASTPSTRRTRNCRPSRAFDVRRICSWKGQRPDYRRRSLYSRIFRPASLKGGSRLALC